MVDATGADVNRKARTGSNAECSIAGSNPAGPIGGVAPGKEYVVGPRRLA